MSAPPPGLERAAERASRSLLAHAGGIELTRYEADPAPGADPGSGRGTAHIRFTGACTGCPARPLTLTASIGPALLAIPGVTEVVAEGVRVDPDAAARLERFFALP